MTHTPTTEPAESLDDLRRQLTFARDLVAALESTIATAEADECPTTKYETVRERVSSKVQREHFERVESPSDRDLIDALAVRVERLEADAMLDMTGAFVQSTAAVLRIRAEVNTKHEQYNAHWLAVQHGGRPAQRALVLAKRETWRQALELVDSIIGERMS